MPLLDGQPVKKSDIRNPCADLQEKARLALLVIGGEPPAHLSPVIGIL